MKREVVIVSAVRTAVGAFGGTLKDITPAELGATVIKGAVAKAGLSPDVVDEVLFGSVLQAGYGQGIARQSWIKAGFPEAVPCTTVNMICGSGLKTVSMAVQSILAGDNEVVVAGGTENMSMAPYLIKSGRWGQRMGNGELYDVMVMDGLWEAFNNYHMGMTAENIVEKWGISREEQDEVAYLSQKKAAQARDTGRFKDEIVPVYIPQRKGDPICFDEDEYIKETTKEKLAALRPAFKRDGGSVTAGNASGINDGASCVVVMSKEKADALGLKPLCTIVGYASAGVDPKIMGIGPVPASKKALEKAGIDVSQLDLVEANEAFAAQAIAVCRDLNLDTEKVNVNGGAIAIGHPIGASGNRILVTLIHELEKRQGTYGLATLCIGGGMGEALVIKRG